MDLTIYENLKVGEQRMEAIKPDPTVERIRALMERRQMNQAQMSRYLGVPQGTIGNWLGGTRTPNRSVTRLLDVLGVVEVMAPDIHEQFIPK